MLNAQGVLLHTTYNLLKASFWLVCTTDQGNITKRSGIQTKQDRRYSDPKARNS